MIPMEYFTTPKYQSMFPANTNGQSLMSFLQPESMKKSSFPPGLDMVAEPPLVKSHVSLRYLEHECSVREPEAAYWPK